MFLLDNLVIMDSEVGYTADRPYKPDKFQISDSLVFKLVQLNQRTQIIGNMNMPDRSEIADMVEIVIMKILFRK